MFSFSFFEVLVVIGLSASILAWQSSAWLIADRFDTNGDEQLHKCALSFQATHRREDEKYWFSENGELICGESTQK
ncbi:hypothetical protein CWE13_03890 [Aliidiomarina shirensis]|uniref:Prepilin-type cleavage/methylation domain-containing protein n=1 Tax=Aliidiomarina shirensis TaxID=1048642 RepID=A0A432WYC7_9GAMM|nr:hypothetical protein [Aliidiomarina shirensis]RUO38783.1 hypothetical protein CWE13_03890 [Aliidiomarina shirensis]